MDVTSQNNPRADSGQAMADDNSNMQSQKSATIIKSGPALNNNSAASNANNLSNNHNYSQGTATNSVSQDIRPGNDDDSIRSILNEVMEQVSITVFPETDQTSQEPATADSETDEKPSDCLQKGVELSPDDGTCDLVIDSDLPPSVEEESPSAINNEQNNYQSKASETVPMETVNDSTSASTYIKKEESNASTESEDEQDESANALQFQSNDNISQATTIELSQTRSLDTTSVVKSEICKKDDIEMEDPHEKTKDMVTLRNVELSPPPPPIEQEVFATYKVKEATKHEGSTTKTSDSAPSARRKRTESLDSNDDMNETTSSVGRSKRQRTKTQLFQAGEPAVSPDQIQTPTSTAKSRPQRVRAQSKSTTPKPAEASVATTQEPINDLQDVIFYEKNDYLALRNENDSFFLCQLAENVRVKRPLIKIKWLDTNDDGKTYFLTSQFDKVPQKSIIMPVALNKLKSEKKGVQLYTLDDQDRDNIIDRLTRSLNVPKEESSSQETTVEQ